MAKLTLKKAATDVSVYVFAQDSSKTTGVGLTGLAYNTASLTAYYVRPLGSATAITLATQTVTGAHSDGGFVEIDATNMPGVYRLDLPDAVCATGVPSAVVMLKGATNLAPVLLEIQLTDFDLNTAFTSALVADAVLDEATSGHTSAGSFSKAVTDILADTGTDGVVVASLANDSITAAALKADAVTEIQNGLATPTNITAGTLTTVTNLTNLPTMPHDWISAVGISSDAAQYLGAVVWAKLLSENNTEGSFGKAIADILGDTNELQAELADGGRTDLLIDAIKAKTDNLPADPADDSDIDAAIAAVKSVVDDILVDTGTDGVKINATQGAITWGQQKIIADADGEGALDIVNTGDGGGGVGIHAEGQFAGQLNEGTGSSSNGTLNTGVDFGQLNEGRTGQLNVGTNYYGVENYGLTQNVQGYDPALALEATLTAIKGAGWTTETLAALDALIDGIKAKTDQLTFTTANKVDASATVDPTGIATSAALAVVDANVDAIKAKTDLLDVSSVTVNSAISGTAITILRGDTFECSISGLGSLASYVSLDFTVKANKTQADTEALIRIRLNATGLTDGLLTLNGATPSSADDGSIAITDAAAGDITITLAASCTDDLATGTYAYDVQLIEVGDVSTLTSGKATVIADVTRAVA